MSVWFTSSVTVAGSSSVNLSVVLSTSVELGGVVSIVSGTASCTSPSASVTVIVA